MASPGSTLVVPHLGHRERIDDWQRLFKAAVALLLAKGEEAERLAVSMLPAYICRRPAERIWFVR